MSYTRLYFRTLCYDLNYHLFIRRHVASASETYSGQVWVPTIKLLYMTYYIHESPVTTSCHLVPHDLFFCIRNTAASIFPPFYPKKYQAGPFLSPVNRSALSGCHCFKFFHSLLHHWSIIKLNWYLKMKALGRT